MRSHLLVFDPSQVDKDSFRSTVDGLTSVENWMLFFGNTMCVISEQPARVLSKEIHDAMPGVRFLISTIEPTQKNGWLPKDVWAFMNSPSGASAGSDA